MRIKLRPARLLRVGVGVIGILVAGVAQEAGAQLDERCTVSVLNRTVKVNPDGSWVLPNIPANFGQVRARATCLVDGQTISGESDLFTVPANGVVNLQPIVFGKPTPIPRSMTLNAPTETLTQQGATLQLEAIARYADGTSKDVTADPGIQYTVSNTAIATVSATGLVQAQASGSAIVQATLEGASGLFSIQIALSGSDSDGDGIPDDYELARGLDPNNAIDAREDADRDGLTTLQEFHAGTEPRNPDTDGDSAKDGDELDVHHTNPLLFDTDGDGIPDGVEVTTGSNPLDRNSYDLRAAAASSTVHPASFILRTSILFPDVSQLLRWTVTLVDGKTTLDLTADPRTTYTSSDLTICNFGGDKGRVFAGLPGPCQITLSNSTLSAVASGSVESFTPTALSFVDIPGFANNVAVAGNYAYVAAGSAGLQIVDVTDRALPSVVASRPLPGNANDVVVSGGYAYVAAGSGGLQIVNVQNPTSPTTAGALDTGGIAWDVVVVGNRAYVANGASGLVVADVSSPAAPVQLGSLALTGTAKGVDVDPQRQIAVVALGTSGLAVVNVADASAMTLAGMLGSGDVRDVVIANTVAYLADLSRSFTAVDISNPATPLRQASTPSATGGLLQDVAVNGSVAAGADVFFVNGVPLIDIRTPLSPEPRLILNFSGFRDDNGTGIAMDSRFVYLTAETGMTENGVSGATRLYIGQYRDVQDTAGIAPTVRITSPANGAPVIQGATLTVTATADDDVAVASVRFFVDGQLAFTATAAPYQFTLTAPASGSTLTLGATAVDFGNNATTAANVSVNLIADPLTTVTGRVIDGNGAAVADAAVSTLTRSATTEADGTFSIGSVPTISGNIVVSATVDLNGTTLTGKSAAVPPIAGGTTNVGDIVVTEPAAFVSLAPADSPSLPVGNCIPFGDNVQFGFTGFIYRNVPAFELKVGGHISFDLGAMNDVPVRRNIYLAVANRNPAPGGARQGIRALAWTQVVSDSQIPENPRGDFTKGNYELTYTAEAPFSFPGGGFIVGVGGSPPGLYADGGCDQVLVQTTPSDPSGFFHRRFYFRGHLPMEELDSGSSDTFALGGVVIRPNR